MERTIPADLKDTDLFEQIFSKILEDCMKYKLVDTEQIFVDATHVKACANSKKMRKRIAREQTLWYEEELNKEIKKTEWHMEKTVERKKITSEASFVWKWRCRSSTR